jgi:Dolichyl-phosphate-mannose-protein mannosyltransferase
MALKQKKNRAAAKAVAPKPQAEQPSFWEVNAEPFLDRWALLMVALLLLLGAARIAATYRALSNTNDEFVHYVTGLEYLTDHAYRLETQHPPLERAAGALIPYLMGARSSADVRRAPFVLSRDDADRLRYREVFLQLPPDSRTVETLVRMRWGVLPFFLIAGLVVYEWTRYALGKPAAVLATALFTLTPPVLAHAGLATTDIALTACLAAAFLSLLRWAAGPGIQRAVILGLWTALAVLSKFSTLVYLPAATVAAVAAYLAVRRPSLAELRGLARARLATFAVAVGTGALVIWAGYWFSVGSVPWKPGLLLPAPALFDGIKSVIEHSQRGHLAYLLEQRSWYGWWYFFPVVLGVKTPLAILLVFGFGLFACWKRKDLRVWAPVAFAAGILLPAMAGDINIGVRHILPIYVSFAIIGGLGLVELASAARTRGRIVVILGILLAWLAMAGIRQHPDYLAYFNELAGAHPERIIVDSDLDWGQDAKRAADRLRELGATEASLFITGDFEHDQSIGKWYGFPPLKPFQQFQPNPGWNVVSPTSVALAGGWHAKSTLRFGGRSLVVAPWYESIEPTEKAGALFLYYTPPGFRPPVRTAAQ